VPCNCCRNAGGVKFETIKRPDANAMPSRSEADNDRTVNR
jgi:hypothetical protein